MIPRCLVLNVLDVAEKMMGEAPHLSFVTSHWLSDQVETWSNKLLDWDLSPQNPYRFS